MKHILNDLTEQEKNAIREQHTGGMKVMTEKFSKLTNSKLGDVKLISEQPLPNKPSALATSMSKPIVGMLPQIKACVAQGGYPKLSEFLKKQENKQLDNIVIDMLMTFSVKKDPQASSEIGKLIECLQKSSKSGSSMQNEQVMQTLKNVAMKGVDYAKKGLNMIQGKTGNKFFDAAISAKLGTMQDGKSSNEKVFCMDDSCEDSLRVFSDGRVVYERAEFNTKKKGKMALNSDNSFVIKFDDGTSSPKLMPK
jgi:hypothetical protein